MSDDWEDWEEESFAPPALKPNALPSDKTKGDLLLAKAKEVDMSKFEGEDEGEEEEPKYKNSIPKPEQVRLSSVHASQQIFSGRPCMPMQQQQ